jgi:hypothetical protein
MVYDSVRQRIVLFGGTNFMEVWGYVGVGTAPTGG